MEKPIVSPSRFVELVNARLREHPLYREGMEVYAIPRHSATPRSLVCAGPLGATGVCETVENIVRGECEVVPEIRGRSRHEPVVTSPTAYRSW